MLEMRARGFEVVGREPESIAFIMVHKSMGGTVSLVFTSTA